MYKIIGGDQREYGPITAEQLRQWIAEGRANAQSNVQTEGSTDWKPLGDLPEFAATLSGAVPPTSPPLPPNLATLAAEQIATDILARGYDLDIGRCVGRSWALVKRHFWLTVGVTFIVFAIQVGIGAAIPILGAIAGMILGGVLQGGLFFFFLKLIRGQRAEVGDAFAGFNLAFVPLMLGGIVVSLLSAVGFFCCVLPGIYLAVAWMFTLPLIIDKRIDFWPAMELSRKVVSRHWWVLFGLLIVNFFIMVAGVLACLIGTFVAGPIIAGALAFAYEDIFGATPATAVPALRDPLLPVTPVTPAVVPTIPTDPTVPAAPVEPPPSTHPTE